MYIDKQNSGKEVEMIDSNLIEILRKSRNLRDKEETHNFYQVLDSLQPNQSEKSLAELFYIFSDDVEEIHGLQSLQSYLETASLESFIEALFIATPRLLIDAPRWLNKFYLRILNSDNAVPVLQNLYKKLDSSQKQIIQQEFTNLKVYANTHNTDEWRDVISRKIDSVIIG